MARRNAEPAIILRITPRGVVPATGFDAELIGRLRVGSDLQARPLKVEQSAPLKAWWLLCSRTADCLSDQSTARSVSNNVLLALGMVEEEALFGGGTRKTPMSLTDFTDEQLYRLVEAAKLHVHQVVIPNVDIELLMKVTRT